MAKNAKLRDPLTLHPLDFETAVRAAMQTGSPLKNKEREGKRKQKA
jgi:hypothetical protein